MLPQTPSNRQSPEGLFLHWGFSPASRSSSSSACGSRLLASPGTPGRRHREPWLSSSSSLAGSRWSEPASRLLFSFIIAAFSRLALGRAAGRACSSSLSPGEALPPRTPPNRQRAEALFLHWWFSRASRSSPALVVSSPVSTLKGRPGELPPQPASSLARSRWAAGQARPILVHRHCVLSARPCRAAERACSSSLSVGGALPLPHPPPIVAAASCCSSTICSRHLKVPLGQSVRTLKCSSLQAA